MTKEEIFDLEKQYALYLEGMGLKESTMHPQERIERKRAFIAGIFQVLTTLSNVGADMTEQEIFQALDRMLAQSKNIISSFGDPNVN